ncbi:MAG: restriction endonuclease subunit S [Nostoc sp.]
MSEELTELPEGWEWVQADNLCQIISGYAFKSTDFCDEGVPAIKIANISYGTFLYKQQEYLPKDFLDKYSEFQVIPKTLLIALTRPITNNTVKACLYPEYAPIGLLNQRVALIKPYKIYSQKLLLFFSKSDFFRNQVNTNLSETLQPNLSPQSLKQFLIPLPPLNEQKRIVTKIEELNDRTQKAKKALDSIPQLCDRFRQSVLAAAFRGDLTADWREQNPDVEPASMLLQRIRAKNKQTHKRKSNATPSSIVLEMDKITPIPNTWQWVSFGELITSIRSGSTAVPQDEVSSYPILRSSSVRSCSVDLTDIRYLTKSENENEDNFLNDGDLLFTRLSGSIEYVANCALVRDLANRRIQYPDRLFRAKLIDREFSTYSELWFATPLLRSLITDHAKSTAGHQRISMTAITEAPIPLPPLVEQQKIVEIVRSFLELITNVEQQYQQAKGKLNQLNQSILAKAFMGELVPQDPDDEPASVLLERIRAEREKLNNGKPKSDRTSKRKSKTVEGQGFISGLE